MNYLVTGACGFIGSKLAEKLISSGHSVTTVDNLSTGSLDALPPGVELIEGDCFDEKCLSKLHKKNFDAIFHIAGQSSGEISFDDPVYDLQTNTQSTLMLLDLAKKNNCRKFIYASSMSVYGNLKKQPVSENCPLQPISFYAIGKLASEHYLRTYSGFGLQTISLRLFNVYGPGQNMKNLRQGMVSIYLAQAFENGEILVKGSGERYRDLVYIDDVVNAFCKTLEYDKKGYHCFNIGTNVKTTVDEIVSTISVRLKKNIKVVNLKSTPGDTHGIYADTNYTKTELNWKHTISFSDGLKKMIDWFDA
jgi:UDP-glucose 4-epimerase